MWRFRVYSAVGFPFYGFLYAEKGVGPALSHGESRRSRGALLRAAFDGNLGPVCGRFSDAVWLPGEGVCGVGVLGVRLWQLPRTGNEIRVPIFITFLEGLVRNSLMLGLKHAHMRTSTRF